MKPLKEALTDLKKNPEGARAHADVAAALTTQKVMAPAIWDQEPEPDGKGNVVFPKGTNVQLVVLQKEDGTTWFPFFTDQEASVAFNPNARCLVLTYPQLMQFIHMAGGKINGAVFNPGTMDVSVDREFLLRLEAIQDRNMSINQLRKGDKVTVRRPGEEGIRLANALAAAAKDMPEVLSLHLLMRIMPDKSEHWLVVAGMEPEDPAIFRKLASRAGREAGGKNLEFLFDTSSVGKKISAEHEPVYTKSLN